MKNPVFILSLFDTGYYAARLLRHSDLKIYGFDHDDRNPGFYSNNIQCFLVPHPLKEPDKLHDFLLSKRYDFNNEPILIPASEIYLSFIQDFRIKLESEFLFLIPESNVLNKVLNKSGQFEMAKNASIPVPYYKKVYNFNDLKDLSNTFQFPIIIKALDQSVWKMNVNKKVFIINDKAELIAKGKELLSRNISFLVQELISGSISNNFEYNALMINGKIIDSHIVQKIQQYPIGSGAACCVETIQNQDIEDLGKRFIEKNKIEGFSNTEFKYDKHSGLYYFIETNTRVWQQIELTNNIGQNFMLSYYSHLSNIIIPNKNRPNRNIIWIDLPSFIILFLKHRREIGLSFFKVIKTVFTASNHGLFNLHDLNPFINTVLLKRKRI